MLTAMNPTAALTKQKSRRETDLLVMGMERRFAWIVAISRPCPMPGVESY